jgi:hypothetical protein
MNVSDLKAELDKYNDEDEVILNDGEEDLTIDSVSSDGVDTVIILMGEVVVR